MHEEINQKIDDVFNFVEYYSLPPELKGLSKKDMEKEIENQIKMLQVKGVWK